MSLFFPVAILSCPFKINLILLNCFLNEGAYIESENLILEASVTHVALFNEKDQST